MPHRTGPGTYNGYQSPNTSGWPKEIRDEVRHVYGAYRVKNPGESHAIKGRGARIAWAAARRKYPKLYSRHVRDQRRLAFETKKELKEHPWAGQKTATRIAADHIREQSSLHRAQPHGMHRIGDLHAAARQERAYARTAKNEAISERKRSEKLKREGKTAQANDLKQDAKVAGDFAKIRSKVADQYDMEAARISKVTGG